VVELRLPRQRVAILLHGLRREEPEGVEVRALALVRLDNSIDGRLVDAERQ